MHERLEKYIQDLERLKEVLKDTEADVKRLVTERSLREDWIMRQAETIKAVEQRNRDLEAEVKGLRDAALELIEQYPDYSDIVRAALEKSHDPGET